MVCALGIVKQSKHLRWFLLETKKPSSTKRVLRIGYILKQHDLSKSQMIRRIGLLNEYIVSIQTTNYHIKRIGKCEPTKCDSACCKVLSFNIKPGTDWSSYINGFADKRIGDHALISKTCCQLRKNGKCGIWKLKKFPGECEQFPHPTDGVYIAVLPVCSFKFKIVGIYDGPVEVPHE